jgi:hypothetical protein
MEVLLNSGTKMPGWRTNNIYQAVFQALDLKTDLKHGSFWSFISGTVMPRERKHEGLLTPYIAESSQWNRQLTW